MKVNEGDINNISLMSIKESSLEILLNRIILPCQVNEIRNDPSGMNKDYILLESEKSYLQKEKDGEEEEGVKMMKKKERNGSDSDNNVKEKERDLIKSLMAAIECLKVLQEDENKMLLYLNECLKVNKSYSEEEEEEEEEEEREYEMTANRKEIKRRQLDQIRNHSAVVIKVYYKCISLASHRHLKEHLMQQLKIGIHTYILQNPI